MQRRRVYALPNPQDFGPPDRERDIYDLEDIDPTVEATWIAVEDAHWWFETVKDSYV